MAGLLVVVSGPSGVGKGTILNRLLQQRGDCTFSISATTRSPRPGEVHGEHYHFLDHDTFTHWVEQGRFLEWNQVHDQFYGTPRDYVAHQRSQGQHVLLDVDVQGGLQVMQAEPDHLSVFIAPPDLETLKHRLVSRGTETAEQVQKRLLTARVELRSLEQYRYVVVNHEIERSVSELNAILTGECLRTERLRQSGKLPRFVETHGESGVG